MSFPDDLLRVLRPPPPPAGLRLRVLDGAAESMVRPESRVDRLWHSRSARRLWLAATVLLAALNLVLFQDDRPTAAAAPAAVFIAPTSLQPRPGPPLGGIEEQLRLAEAILLADSPRRGS